MNAPRPGLRERKKRETENAIEMTAVSLALTKGHSSVTVAEICDGANISRSTFFNYMPNREAAIFGKPIVIIPYEEATEILGDAAGDSIAQALFDIVVVSIGHGHVNPEVSEGRIRLAAEQPDTKAMILSPLTLLTEQLTALVVRWLSERPEHRRHPHMPLQREALLNVFMVTCALQLSFIEADGDTDVTMSDQYFAGIVADMHTISGR